jgi:hypothetical protein
MFQFYCPSHPQSSICKRHELTKEMRSTQDAQQKRALMKQMSELIKLGSTSSEYAKMRKEYCAGHPQSYPCVSHAKGASSVPGVAAKSNRAGYPAASATAASSTSYKMAHPPSVTPLTKKGPTPSAAGAWFCNRPEASAMVAAGGRPVTLEEKATFCNRHKLMSSLRIATSASERSQLQAKIAVTKPSPAHVLRGKRRTQVEQAAQWRHPHALATPYASRAVACRARAAARFASPTSF